MTNDEMEESITSRNRDTASFAKTTASQGGRSHIPKKLRRKNQEGEWLRIDHEHEHEHDYEARNRALRNAVGLYQGDAGGVVFAVDDGGVAAGGEEPDER